MCNRNHRLLSPRDSGHGIHEQMELYYNIIEIIVTFKEFVTKVLINFFSNIVYIYEKLFDAYKILGGLLSI